MTCGCNNPLNPCGNAEENAIDASGCGGNIAPTTPCGTVSCDSSCPEDHCQKFYIDQFYTAIRCDAAWNVPDCGESAVVAFSAVKSVLLGSYLWNTTYGYFKIIDFDVSRALLTLENMCIEGYELQVGAQVPGCTLFIVTPPPDVTQQSDLYPYLAADCVTPAVGNCIPIEVTSIQGLSVGKNVVIGPYTFRISSIDNATHIHICNDGGATPLQTLIALNPAGHYQYPIVMTDTNPCTNAVTNRGVLIVCDDELMKPLHAPAQDMVPVSVSGANDQVEFRALDVPTRVCTNLTACLIVTNGVAIYTLVVADTSGFVNGDVLEIAGLDTALGTPTRFHITNVVDGTHLLGTLVPTPAGDAQIDPGAWVCEIGCCEVIANELDEFRVVAAGDIIDGTIIPAAEFGGHGYDQLIGDEAQILIQNSSANYPMQVMYGGVNYLAASFLKGPDLPASPIAGDENPAEAIITIQRECVLGTPAPIGTATPPILSIANPLPDAPLSDVQQPYFIFAEQAIGNIYAPFDGVPVISNHTHLGVVGLPVGYEVYLKARTSVTWLPLTNLVQDLVHLRIYQLYSSVFAKGTAIPT